MKVWNGVPGAGKRLRWHLNSIGSQRGSDTLSCSLISFGEQSVMTLFVNSIFISSRLEEVTYWPCGHKRVLFVMLPSARFGQVRRSLIEFICHIDSYNRFIHYFLGRLSSNFISLLLERHRNASHMMFITSGIFILYLFLTSLSCFSCDVTYYTDACGIRIMSV